MPHLFVLTIAMFALAVLALEVWPFAVGLGADGMTLTLSSIGPSVSGALRRRRGRPRKFDAPSRAVTLTLPETVIAALGTIHPDLSRAVVDLAKRRRPRNGQTTSAELAVFGRRAIITVPPTPSLAAQRGIELVPLPDGRALISLEQPASVADLELLLHDALEDRSLSDEDRRVFASVHDILRDARRSNDVSLMQRSIIMLEAVKKSRAAASAAAKSRKR